PPPPPPPEEQSYRSEALARDYPPPPPPMERKPNVRVNAAIGTAKKSGYRPTSIDMEIDSLTNMLADMESNSPFPSRSRPVRTFIHSTYSSTLPSPPPAADSTANTLPSSRPTVAASYTQASPSVAASKSTSGPPPAYSNGRSARPQPQPQPQPVAASYATAPARPPTNVQVRVAQPSHSYVGPAASVYAPSPARQPEPAYSAQQQRPEPLQHQTQQHHPPPQQQQQQRPGEVQSAYGTARPVDPGYGSRYGDQGQGHTANRQQAEPAYGTAYNAGTDFTQAQAPAYHQPPQGQLAMSGYTPGQHQASAYAPAQLKKAYHSDDLPPSVPGSAQQTRASSPIDHSHPEDEVDRLTKKMLHDMNNPPSEEYFGKCARCGENVVGDGNGCTAMEQVFHVDCFTCLTCNARLRGQPFYAVEGKAYCEGCYI
uniref:LIM zinc-binding domain-containing protein n=1 Tax=Petromyzon marinus TaxID=7757 RepID=S4RHT6_PETMA